MPTQRLNSTSFALLALLAIRPFTTYELAQQMKRTLSWIWPRAASGFYEESKNLVAAGLATSKEEFTGRRRRTVYAITDAGRTALRDWLGEPGAGMKVEFEALIKVAFADHGDREQLLAVLRAIRADAEAQRFQVIARMTDYAGSGGPFPDRLPVIALTGKLLMEQAEVLVRWAEWAEDAVAGWSGVTPATGATVPADAFTPDWSG